MLSVSYRPFNKAMNRSLVIKVGVPKYCSK